MNRLYRLISVVILMCILVGTFASCNSFDFSSLKESEQPPLTSADDEQESVTETEKETETETETETEEPNPLAKVISISLDRFSGKGKLSIYWGDRTGLQTGISLMGVTRVLYRTKKGKLYNEISLSDIGSADGTGISIGEDNELMHLIVVFKKDYKLTDNNMNSIKELGLDYMFEK